MNTKLNPFIYITLIAHTLSCTNSQNNNVLNHNNDTISDETTTSYLQQETHLDTTTNKMDERNRLYKMYYYGMPRPKNQELLQPFYLSGVLDVSGVIDFTYRNDSLVAITLPVKRGIIQFGFKEFNLLTEMYAEKYGKYEESVETKTIRSKYVSGIDMILWSGRSPSTYANFDKNNPSHPSSMGLTLPKPKELGDNREKHPFKGKYDLVLNPSFGYEHYISTIPHKYCNLTPYTNKYHIHLVNRYSQEFESFLASPSYTMGEATQTTYRRVFQQDGKVITIIWFEYDNLSKEEEHLSDLVAWEDNLRIKYQMAKDINTKKQSWNMEPTEAERLKMQGEI